MCIFNYFYIAIYIYVCVYVSVCVFVCVSVCVCLCVTSFPKIMMDPSGKINNTQQWVLQNPGT